MARRAAGLGWFMILAIGVALCEGPAGATPASEAAAAAKRHYEDGVKLYDLQRYDEAAREYELAFAAHPDAALLYNIGQSYRLAHVYDKAIGAYKAYLRRMPEARNRADVERVITDCEGLANDQRGAELNAAREREAKVEQDRLAEQRRLELQLAAERERTAQTRAAAERPRILGRAVDRRTARTVKWAGVGALVAGVVVVGAGAGLYAAGHKAADQIDHPAPGSTFDAAAESRARSLQPTGAAILAVGGIAIVGGVVATLLGVRGERAAPRLSASAGGFGLTF